LGCDEELLDASAAQTQTLSTDIWRSEWAEYDGDSQAIIRIRIANRTRVAWEGAKANAVALNCWYGDHVRAECRDATLVLDSRELERCPYKGDDTASREGNGVPVPLDERECWTGRWLLEQFVAWLDGGPEMARNVRDNLQSVALVEAAIQSSRTGDSVQVQKLLDEVASATEWD